MFFIVSTARGGYIAKLHKGGFTIKVCLANNKKKEEKKEVEILLSLSLHPISSIMKLREKHYFHASVHLALEIQKNIFSNW